MLLRTSCSFLLFTEDAPSPSSSTSAQCGFISWARLCHIQALVATSACDSVAVGYDLHKQIGHGGVAIQAPHYPTPLPKPITTLAGPKPTPPCASSKTVQFSNQNVHTSWVPFLTMVGYLAASPVTLSPSLTLLQPQLLRTPLSPAWSTTAS